MRVFYENHEQIDVSDETLMMAKNLLPMEKSMSFIAMMKLLSAFLMAKFMLASRS